MVASGTVSLRVLSDILEIVSLSIKLCARHEESEGKAAKETRFPPPLEAMISTFGNLRSKQKPTIGCQMPADQIRPK